MIHCYLKLAADKFALRSDLKNTCSLLCISILLRFGTFSMNEEKSKSNNFGKQQPKKKTAISIATYTVLFTKKSVEPTIG